MKQSDEVLQQLASGKPLGSALASASQREGAGQARQEGRPRRDLVDAINQMFAEFELAYHNQFHRAYQGEGNQALAKKYWLTSLSRYSPEVILKATRALVSASQYLPTLAAMTQACEDALSLFGLPAAYDAYIEACQAPHPKAAQHWSHPAVYYAGRATDWFSLESEPASKVFPRFEHHYRMFCQRVLNGEDLSLPAVEAIAHNPSQPLAPDEQKARLQALRDKLDL